MIHSISIENFFSIAEKQVINFRVPRNAPHVENFAESRGDQTIRLPLVAGFFGANASGKSTVLRAITSVSQLVIEASESRPSMIDLLFQPYRSAAWFGKPTKIIVEFDEGFANDSVEKKTNSVMYRYEIHIANQFGSFRHKNIEYEKLSYARGNSFKILFERKLEKFEIGKDFQLATNNPILETVTEQSSALGRFAFFNHKFSRNILREFAKIVGNFALTAKYNLENRVSLEIYFNNPDYLSKLNAEIQRFDLGLQSLSVGSYRGEYVASSKHVGLDAEIELEMESHGTKNFINLFPLFQIALDDGGVLIVDEIDSDLHPLLVPELLSWFYDPIRNPHKAQLLFSAHNVSLLDELEKAQVFFTEKPMGKATRIYGAKDIGGLRREPSLAKKYLSGELGAVPQIG